GLMQINSSWLSRWNLTREELLSNVCLNIEIGAWILRENLNKFGNPWEAVGAYNASCSSLKGDECRRARQRYAWKVYYNLTHLDDFKREMLKKAVT
ncbi:MAG: lytic transglycosylase domain-containing protein, partial [Burkholderiales bacterium]|nr:lytic transglycosylase domain-containing protein [Burkholderiales bacterium]